MKYPLIFIPSVYHVGTMDIENRLLIKKRYSLEGNCISVSITPEAWMDIAEISGVCHKFYDPEAAYLDIRSLDRKTVSEALCWALENDLIKMENMWSVKKWDGETEEFISLFCISEEEALSELEFDDDNTSEIDLKNNIIPVQIPVLTEIGAEKCCVNRGFVKRSDCTDYALILWAENVLKKKIPNLAGCWWKENFDPDNLSAPRGGVFLSHIDKMEKTISDFPDFYDDDIFERYTKTVLIDPTKISSKYVHVGNCVELDGDDINDMVDVAVSVPTEDFFAELGHGDYSKGLDLANSIVKKSILNGSDPISLDKDYHVNFYRSIFNGIPCLYVVHSAIEVVFQKNGLLQNNLKQSCEIEPEF